MMTTEIKRAFLKGRTVALGDVIEIEGCYAHVISINARGNAIRYISADHLWDKYRFCTRCHQIVEKHVGTKCLFFSTRLNIAVDTLDKKFEDPQLKIAKKQLHDFHRKQQGRLDGNRVKPVKESRTIYRLIPTSDRLRGMSADMVYYDDYTYWDS
jgi:hypothetical protein